MRAAISSDQPTRGSQHEQNGEISDVTGGDTVPISDGDAALPAAVEVNLVDADARACDEAKVGEGEDEGGGGAESDKGNDGGRVLGDEGGGVGGLVEDQDGESLLKGGEESGGERGGEGEQNSGLGGRIRSAVWVRCRRHGY